MPTEEIDWLACPDFTGPEADKPTGTLLPKGFKASDFVADGSMELTKNGGIIDLAINESMYKKVMATYGPKAIMIREANGVLLTREEWYKKMGHTDGLKLAVIRELSNPGGGVVAHKPGGKDSRYKF